MSLIAKDEGKTKMPPIDEGSYAAVCYGLVDIGTQHTNFEGREKDIDKVLIMWEIPGETVEFDGQQVPRTISKEYTNSLNEKSTLRKDLKSWRGREFTDEELKAFDLRNIVGVPCLLQIIHKPTTTGGVYANVASVMSVPKGMQKPTGFLEQIIFDIDTATGEEMKALPEWIQKKVTAAVNWQYRESTSDGSGPPDWEQLEGTEDDLPF